MLLNNNEYLDLVQNIKQEIQHAQYKAALSVNRELITLYYNIGKLINEHKFLPDLRWNRKLGELLLDSHLGLHIAGIVALEQLPLVRCMEGPVPCTLAIGLCGETGLAKVFDELLSKAALKARLMTEASSSAASDPWGYFLRK